MFNAIVGAPVGGQFGPGFRPYFSGGIGMLSREVQSEDDLFDVNSNEWGFNLGAGAMGFATDHVGFRGDLRYFRSLRGSRGGNELDVVLGGQFRLLARHGGQSPSAGDVDRSARSNRSERSAIRTPERFE